MTRPGEVIPPAPGWWPRTARVGVGAAGYGWAVTAVGVSDHLGEVATGYGFSGTATGVAPILVQYDAVGAGGGSNTGFSFDGPSATAGDCVLVFLASEGAASVTYDGTAMKFWGYAGAIDNSGVRVYLSIYYLNAVASGVKTVAVTTPSWTSAQAIAYKSVATLGFPKVVTGSGTSLSQAVTCSAGNMTVQGFFAPNPSGQSKALTSLSGGTARWHNTGAIYIPVASVGDTSANATFAASFDSGPWGGLAVPLLREGVDPGIVLDNVGPGQAPDPSAALALSHVVLTTGADIFVDVVTDRSATISSATCGGAAMSQVGTIVWGTGNQTLWRYRAANQTAGTKTISVSLGGGPWVWGNSISLLNVSSVGSAQTTSGSSSQPSHAVTCSAGQVILDAIVSASALTAPFGGGIGLWDYPAANSLMQRIADASTTFSTANTGVNWGALANVIS